MKRGIIVVFVLLTLCSGLAAGQSTVKEDRDLKGFTKVNFGVSGNMYITLGSEFKVVLEGEKRVLDDIITDVSSGKLVIKKENWHFNSNDRITVYVTMPEIIGLGVSGSGRAEIKDAVKGDNLNLSVSGSGKLYTGEINVNSLGCGISGSGDIILGGGKASTGDISISGSGNFTGESTSIESADVSISGSGNCVTNVSESLKASISGSGNVSYSGGAKKVDARVSGSGKIRSR